MLAAVIAAAGVIMLAWDVSLGRRARNHTPTNMPSTMTATPTNSQGIGNWATAFNAYETTAVFSMPSPAWASL